VLPDVIELDEFKNLSINLDDVWQKTKVELLSSLDIYP